MLSNIAKSMKKAAKAANPMNAGEDSAYYADLYGDGVERASLKLLDWSTVLPVQFNPSQLTITRGAADLGGQKEGQTNVPSTQYTGHGRDKLDCDLLFDASEDKDGEGSIMGLIKSLHALTMPYDFGEEKGGIRPPLVLFMWGTDGIQFAGVLQTATYTITMFNAAGMPMRATVNVSIEGEFMPSKTGVSEIIAAEFKPEKGTKGKAAAKDAAAALKALTQD